MEEPLSMISSDREITPAIDAVVIKCMAKEPSDRYDWAGDIVSDLRTAISDPVVASDRAHLDAQAVPAGARPGRSSEERNGPSTVPCPRCGRPVPSGYRFCSKCGSPIQVWVCWRCRSPVAELRKFCGRCGAPRQRTPTVGCQRCGHQNPGGRRFCSQCGAVLRA
jgi:hypothetical protein